MRLDDFDFVLPEKQIARHPLAERDASRLLLLRRTSGRVSHHSFRELPDLLQPGDLLVLNDTRVFPARLLGSKAGTGGRAELLLVRPADGAETGRALEEPPHGHAWICLGQASKGLKPGADLNFGALRARVEVDLGEGQYRVRFSSDAGATLGQLLEDAGQLPLPPYLDRAPVPEDDTRYQTVFARETGSAAAPTAGLHFTPHTFAALSARRVDTASLTLDVGPGTFMPVRGDLAQHRMHAERFRIPASTAASIDQARAEGRRIIAAGTTVVRTLESATDPVRGTVLAGDGDTELFIHPGYTFRQVDALLTNFHLPRSTLLMLVCAFAGQSQVLAAYDEAVREGYRFFSYGDAMLVLPDDPG